MRLERLSIPISTQKDKFFETAEGWLKNPNSDAILEHGGSLYQFVHFLDEEAFENIRSESWEDDNTIAFLMYNLNSRRDSVDNIEIYINKSAFIRNEGDFTDLIPIVIRHETAELYYMLVSADGEVADGYPYQQAVIEEFKFAHSLHSSIAARYMQLIMLWANDLSTRKQEFIQENLSAFIKTMN